jgi:cobalt-zinc-cadmium resistance protein CzcA
MLEKIISTCLKQKNLIIVMVLLIAALGAYSIFVIPIDAFPDVTNNQVEITCYANGLSANEIERTVTYKVEMSMKGLPKVKQMRSVTKYGIAIISIIFEDNMDIYFARQLVFERLAEAKESVPKGVEISMGPIATVMGEIYQYYLDGKMPENEKDKVAYLTELRSLQEWVISPLLKGVSGVNEVNSFGGYFKQFQVEVAPDKLSKYDLSLDDIYKAVEENNQNVGGNILVNNSEQYIVRGIGLIKTTGDIENITLKSSNGTPVYLKDVADIKIGQAVRQGASILNGTQECVGGIVMMLRGENAREVVKKVEDKIVEINKINVLPKGITIKPYYDRSSVVESSIKTVSSALLEGAILVLIILYLMLKSIRGSMVVLIALPLALLMTFCAMVFFHIDANLMTLGGLAISLGMIIDTTIIQVENVQRHLSHGTDEKGKFSEVIKAALEVRKPSIFGELIIAITFIPILSLEGIEGKMFTPLALTVIIALLSSLLLSIFVIPVICYIFLKPSPDEESFIMKFVHRHYTPLLNFSMKRKKLIFAGATVLVLSSFALFPFLGTEFIPIMDEGAFDFDVQLLPTVSLDKAVEVNKLISTKLKKFDELETVVGRVGQTGVALDTRGPDKTGYVGIMKPRSEWKDNISREELTEKMREELSSIPGIAYGFSQPIQCRIDELVAGTRAQLIIKLFGTDTDILAQKANEISNTVSHIEGVTDIVTEKIIGQSYLTINIDRNKIARYGINISEAQCAVEIAVGGKTATEVSEDNRTIDVQIRFPEEKRNSIETIGNILVPSSNGYKIPLSQIAEIKFEDGPVQISREDGQRRIGIEMNIQGRDIGSFVSEAKREIKKNVSLPEGYFLAWGGQFESQQRAMNKLMIIVPVAVLLIFFLLFLTFRSFRLASLIIFILPFSLIGGILALFLTGLYLSIPASIGFIVLFGVAVLNGVVLVSQIHQNQEEGMPDIEAIRKGCETRTRPVLMTASISVFSLLPLLFASGPGSEIQKPLAVVVVGGLITSTMLTLIVIPALYEWFYNLGKRIKKQQ